ncbi:nuclear receptor subfamily 0 group B member 2 [Vidua chalybeata]|nr:nuclear receptor subfamily 0 group B member 2 [Vidua chalybeata]
MSTNVDLGCERCRCHGKDRHPPILYTLLSQNLQPGGARQHCLCPQRRTVCLRTPHLTCRAASHVLVKTINFMKNVAAFHLLPREDQLLLLDSCWVPLFLLGLVQEMVTFEVMEAPAPSMLKKILLSGQSKGQEPEGTQPTLAAVQRLQWCLNSFWRLDLSPSEFTYLRGAILFNPDIPGLRAALYIESLQSEAQRALRELLHPEDQARFSHILRVTSSLRSIPAALVTALFFRPVIGGAAMGELLAEMLFEAPGWPQAPWLPLPC